MGGTRSGPSSPVAVVGAARHAHDVALFDASPLAATLARLVNFELLNNGPIRLGVCCIDFSPSSIRERWTAGERDAGAALDALEAGLSVPGLTYVPVI